MSANIRDVADAAGVSVATVSRAMHGQSGVRPETARRVRAVADQLRYSPSAAAARLATSKAGLVTIVVAPEDAAGLGACLAGASSELLANDLDAVLHVAAGDAEDLASRLRGRTDAVIAVTADPSRRWDLDGLAVPVVALGQRVRGLPSVQVDQASIGVRAARYLLSLGHTRLAVVSSRHSADRSGAIARAFEREALGHYRRAEVRCVQPGSGGPAEADRLLAALFHSPDAPSAVFAASEQATLDVYRALLSQGCGPGSGGISLIGTAVDPVARGLSLTVVTTPHAALGRLAARIAVDLLRGVQHFPQCAVLEPVLVVRASTGRLAQCATRGLPLGASADH